MSFRHVSGRRWPRVTDKARANKVKLPENFFLGFDEYSAALPGNAEAPLLGQQLAQIELLLNILIDARVDALTAFRRVPRPEQLRPAATPSGLANRDPLRPRDRNLSSGPR